MATIEDAINQLGDFHFEADKIIIHLTGTLKRENDVIVLEARITPEDAKLIQKQKIEICQIWGVVSSIKVTLLNCLIHLHFLFGSGDGFNTLMAEPTEIIVGRSYTGKVRITRVSASINALNYMFSEELLEEKFDISKENPAMLNFAYPDPINATDEDGELSLFRGFKHSWSREKIEYKILPYMEYRFYSPTEVREAIAKVASARNLFSNPFLRDHLQQIDSH